MGARDLGHVAYLCGITPPRVGVVLNVGSAHLESSASRENIARTKGELVEAVPPADEGGVAVLNADDPLVAAMRPRTRGSRRAPTASRAHADVRAEDEVLDDDGRASLHARARRRAAPRSRCGCTARHHVSNALAVAAAALALGVPRRRGRRRGSRRRPPASRWRMEVSTTPTGVTVVNDAYNANPESVRAALDALVGHGPRDGRPRPRRTWAVLGEMRELGRGVGDRARGDRPRGRAASAIGHVVAVGDAGRTALARGAEALGGATVVQAVPDVDAAVALLRAETHAGRRRPGEGLARRRPSSAWRRWRCTEVTA